ncbi:hypothetical protein V2I80_26160, partial [Pseudomonas viridiflava]|nr:hypothetical protein [Pseudomonas viridiflava]MEE3976040.1 hypothetical protein [Pseudomonas viridiflava]MEE4021123.1 hypothetical protein [Pseudomonas viridiflava]MEE4048943.1 hypothetical protein [Pseudomonas viridiflava]
MIKTRNTETVVGRPSQSLALVPTLFHRHNRPLQALLYEHQPWFSARNLGRLIGWPLNERKRSINPTWLKTGKALSCEVEVRSST